MLNLKPQMIASTLWKRKQPRKNPQDNFQKPQLGFQKLNYDGASKGNPGQGGAGGIFWNSQGSVCIIYTMELGFSTNNEVELMAIK